MKFSLEPLWHLVLPRSSNNQRARLLHPSALTVYIALLLVFQLFLSVGMRVSPAVLGYASNVEVADLLRYTNDQRLQNGLAPVTLNDNLSRAAADKAADMFQNQYWAHTSPQGRDPWSFILAAGYDYLYAGENLARDFADSKAVVLAWMNSASHRENLLNPRYREVGFAVVNGKYAGYETTLVVQMFGTRQGAAPTVAAPQKAATVSAAPLKTTPLITAVKPVNLPVVAGQQTALIDVFSLTKWVSFGLGLGLLLLVATDAILVYRRRIVRISGHSLAHLFLILLMLAALNLIGRGLIL